MAIPLDIFVAAIQQLLLAATFFIIPVVAQRYGDQAQQAAEKAVADQALGTEKDFLLSHGIKFSESGLEMLLPFGIATLLTVIGLLNLSQAAIGRTLTWVIEPLLLVVVGYVTGAQVFTTWYLKRAFEKVEDERLRQVNIEAFLQAAVRAFPAWLRPLQVFRFGLATLGSIVVMLLLAL
jgi:hypothetical protein